MKWEFYPRLETDRFDADKSLHNQARFEPIDEKRVDTYTEAMKRGDKFPPVLAHGRMGKLIMAGGNHRLQAAIKSRKALDTYVISADPQTIVLITFEDNARHGGGSSEEERVQQALYLMDNGAWVKSAAAALAIPEKLVKAASIRRNTDSIPQNTGSGVRERCLPTGAAGCADAAAMLVAPALSEYSGRTAEAYARDLRCWLAACTALRCCPLHASRHDLQRYLQHLERGGLAASTRARHLSGLACLFLLARERGLLQHDPLQHLRRPRRDAVVNRAGLTPDEVAALLAAARNHSPRAHALVGLQALNGLRVSEVLSIRLEQIAISQGHRVVHLIGKGGKPALVPLPQPAAEAVTAAAQGRRRGPLVATRTGRAMDRRAAARLVTGLGEVAGITTGRVHCHALRAAWVTNALRAGVPLHVVQDGARHSDPRQTRLYDRSAQALDGHAAYTVARVIQVAGQGCHLPRRKTDASTGEPVRLPQLVVPGAGQRDDERELGGEQLVVVEADQVGGGWAGLCPPFSSL